MIDRLRCYLTGHYWFTLGNPGTQYVVRCARCKAYHPHCGDRPCLACDGTGLDCASPGCADWAIPGEGTCSDCDGTGTAKERT